MAEYDELRVDGFLVATMIVHGTDADADAPCHYFMLKVAHGDEELVIGACQEASAARSLRDELDKYISQCDADLDGQLGAILDGSDG